MEVTAITVVVPIRTPRRVSSDRNLCVRRVSTASSRSSRIDWRYAGIASSLHAQRVNRVEPGCFGGRIDTEEHAYGGREKQAGQDSARRNRSSEKVIHESGDEDSEGDARNAANGCHNRRL